MSFFEIGHKHVFVDESGDPNLSTTKAGVSEYFVVTAVIVDGAVLSEEEHKAQNIIRRYFPGGELKSSKIGRSAIRRRKILKEISGLDFKHYSQVIDKSQVRSDSGLAFRRSFIKYVNRTVYRQLFQAFTDIHLIADEHGKTEFMQGFADYLKRKLPPALFETATVEFGDSRRFPFLQVADVIAGSISRAYLGKDPMSILEHIRSKTIIIDEWPPRLPRPTNLSQVDEPEKVNLLVRNHSYRYASNFVDMYATSQNPHVQAQVAAVRYLLYHFRSIDPEEYVPTSLIQDHLQDMGSPMSERMLRSRVIGKLREDGVVIASSHRGIKIPYSVEDLMRFVARVNAEVTPYVGRLSRCRKQFLIATEGKLDIVPEREFPELHRYVQQDTVDEA